jgi:hypothetical protein
MRAARKFFSKASRAGRASRASARAAPDARGRETRGRETARKKPAKNEGKYARDYRRKFDQILI